MPHARASRARSTSPARSPSSSTCRWSTSPSRASTLAAAKLIPLPVLERVCAIPFAFDGERLRIAITEPQNVQGLDELRLATRHATEFAVAAREDVLTELRRLARASERAERRADGRRGASRCARTVEADDLEADDGISDAPLVRLVNSIIFQAAEDGASDIHFEPQEDALVVRYRIDGVLHVAERIPLAARLRRDHAPQGAGQPRHRRAAKAAGRTHLAQRRGRRPPARHPRRDAADGRGRVGDDAPARQVARGSDARGARPLRRDARRAARPDPAADRRAARHRADRRPASRRRSTASSARRAGPRST